MLFRIYVGCWIHRCGKREKSPFVWLLEDELIVHNWYVSIRLRNVALKTNFFFWKTIKKCAFLPNQKPDCFVNEFSWNRFSSFYWCLHFVETLSVWHRANVSLKLANSHCHGDNRYINWTSYQCATCMKF